MPLLPWRKICKTKSWLEESCYYIHTALINMAPDDGVSWEGVRESLVQRVRHEFHKLCSEGHGSWDGEVGI